MHIVTPSGYGGIQCRTNICTPRACASHQQHCRAATRRSTLQVVDKDLDRTPDPLPEEPTELEEQQMEPLRLALGSLPHLSRLRLAGETPLGCALTNVPPLQVRGTVHACLLCPKHQHFSIPEACKTLVNAAACAGIMPGGLLISICPANVIRRPLHRLDQVRPLHATVCLARAYLRP